MHCEVGVLCKMSDMLLCFFNPVIIISNCHTKLFSSDWTRSAFYTNLYKNGNAISQEKRVINKSLMSHRKINKTPPKLWGVWNLKTWILSWIFSKGVKESLDFGKTREKAENCSVLLLSDFSIWQIFCWKGIFNVKTREHSCIKLNT